MKIRVMIVDDSILQRAMIRSMLERDEQGRFVVVASANNGVDALEKLKRQKQEIDVITLDVEMPKMNGLDTLKHVMMSSPKPVVMFSSLTKKGAKETISALSLGAVDFITKPESGEFRNLQNELIEKVYRAYKTKSSFEKKDMISSFQPIQITSPIREKNFGEGLTNLILIGTSTGGPRSLSKIMSELPKDLKAAIIIVQHMQTGGFTASFANSLDQISAFHVEESQGGEQILDGHAYVCPAGLQSTIIKENGSLKIELSDGYPEYRHRPSVDVLFKSVSLLKPSMPVYGVILTGMGDDGSDGCMELKKINATIFAESEKTAILYGMPKQVARRGLADYIMDLDDIIPAIEDIIKTT